jgi:release factor glutamine methyltransferase
MVATAVGSRLWRAWLTWRFHLWQRRRHRRLVIEQVEGRPLVILPDVFNPTLFFSSALLARALPGLVRPGDRVLDMGTGSGIQAIAAASLGAQVVAVDIMPEAARCARINVLLTHVDARVEVRQGDLFAPVAGERFDLILFNPPFYQGEPAEPWEQAWRSAGVLDRFASGLPAVLTAGGRAILAVSSVAVDFVTTARRHGIQSRLVAERRLPGERLMILEWIPDGRSQPA